MTHTSIALRFVPLPVPPAAGVRGSTDRRVVADAANSFPCRRCLRDAEVGDELVLLSYDPFVPEADSPYRQPGPIYLHVADCEPDGASLVAAPDQLTRRRLSVRAFDERHLMAGAEVVDGTQVEDLARRLLADPAVAYLHVHNAAPGCFAVRVERGR